MDNYALGSPHHLTTRVYWIVFWCCLVGLVLTESAHAQLVVNEGIVPAGTSHLDYDLDDGICAICLQTGTNGDCGQLGGCTLTAAIQNANRSPDLTTITFSVSVVETPVDLELPAITTPIVIDGSIGTGLAHVRAPAALSTPHGIVISGVTGVEVKNLEISGFSNGLEFRDSLAGTVEGCSIHDNSGSGILASGTTAAMRIGAGTSVPGAPPGNRIYDNRTGIRLEGQGNNLILGNAIGLDAVGEAHGNITGILVGTSGGPGTQVGTEIPDQRNVIAYSQFSGIEVTGVAIGLTEPVRGLVIRGNYIGTDVTGREAAGNGRGITLSRTESILIGGSEANEGNVIAGNGDGIWLNNGANATRVTGNTIGLNVQGDTLPNGNGIVIRAEARDNLVQENVIAGNRAAGVLLTAINDLRPSGNTVELNTIGVDADASSLLLGNGGPGIHVLEADSNAIGLNTIGANGGDGILIEGMNATDTIVLDNAIGVGASAVPALGNLGSGIRIVMGARTTIERNTIGHNAGHGIELLHASDHVMVSNSIGILPNGTEPADAGNIRSGIYLAGESDRNTIGGEIAERGNTLAFNENGVVVAEGQRNRILGNAFFSNRARSIDLGDDGATANDDQDADAGPNGLQNHPETRPADPETPDNMVTGLLRSTPSTVYRIEFFEDRLPVGTTPSPEADVFLGSIEVQTNAEGNATFSYLYEGTDWVSATATDPEGNTSELGVLYNPLLANVIFNRFDDAVFDLVTLPSFVPAPNGLVDIDLGKSIDFTQVEVDFDDETLTLRARFNGNRTDIPFDLRLMVNGEGRPRGQSDPSDGLSVFLSADFQGTVDQGTVRGLTAGTVDDFGNLARTDNPEGVDLTTIDDRTLEFRIGADLLPDDYTLGLAAYLRDEATPDAVGEVLDVIGVETDGLIIARPVRGEHVTVTKTRVERDSIVVGDLVTFDVVVENTGTEPLESLRLFDAVFYSTDDGEFGFLPFMLKPTLSAGCDIASLVQRHLLECTIGTLAPGERWSVRYAVRTSVAGRISNKAQAYRATLPPMDPFAPRYTLGSAVVTEPVLPGAPSALMFDSSLIPSKRLAPRDYYLDGERIADDLEPGTALAIGAVPVAQTQAFLDVVDGAAPDNSEPLTTFEIDFTPADTTAARLAASYAIVLTLDDVGTPAAIVVPDFPIASNDPESAVLTVAHAAPFQAPATFAQYNVHPPFADALPFGAYHVGATIPAGRAQVHVKTQDGEVNEVFAFDAVTGNSYLALLSESAPESDAGAAVSIYRSDGVVVESVTTTGRATGPDLPSALTLESNYPNPFSIVTRIAYQLSEEGPVHLDIFDMLGRRVRTLVAANQFAGRHTVTWDGRNQQGSLSASGLYAYRLEAEGTIRTRVLHFVR